jgi:thiamine biosynthesis protein ThiS
VTRRRAEAARLLAVGLLRLGAEATGLLAVLLLRGLVRSEAARLLAVLLLRLLRGAEASRLLAVLLLRGLLLRLAEATGLGARLHGLEARHRLRRPVAGVLRLRLLLGVARLRAEPALLLRLGVALLGVARLTARRIAAARRISAARRLLHVKSSFLLARCPNLPSPLADTFAKGRVGVNVPTRAKWPRASPGCAGRPIGAMPRRANMTEPEPSIAIVVNGEPREVPSGLTVRGLLEHLGIAGLAAVERNRELVPRAMQASVAVERGDELEIVHLVGGG